MSDVKLPKIQAFLKKTKNGTITPMGGKVLIDGVEVSGLVEFNFSISGGSAGKVTLTLVGDVEIKTDPLGEDQADEDTEPEEKIT